MPEPELDAETAQAALRTLDHAAAEAADAWLNDPRDHEAYRRLVSAVLRRRAHVRPQLPLEEPDEELLDDLGADRPPRALGDALANVMSQLRQQARQPARNDGGEDEERGQLPGRDAGVRGVEPAPPEA